MTIVYQSSNASSLVTVTNGDDLVVRSPFDIYVSGTAVTLASGSSRTGLINQGDIFGILALNVNSDGARIVNEGSIHGVTEDAIDLGGGTGRVEITNLGTITADAHLIDTSEASGDITLHFVNHGTASADYDIINTGFFSTDPVNLRVAYVENTGLMRGAALDLDATFNSVLRNTGTIQTRQIDLRTTFTSSIYNSGVITSMDSPNVILLAGARNTDIRGGDAGVVFANSGQVFGRFNGGSGADRYEGIGAGFVNEGVHGNVGNDTFSGGSLADLLDGGDDQDILVGRGGDDTLLGGAGFDTLIGGDGNDSIDGGNNNDKLLGNDGDDTMLGGFGNDVLVGHAGADSLDGGAGNDTLDGGAGNDILEGGDDNDVLRGGDGADELSGGLGLDFYTGGADDDIFIFRTTAHAGIGATRDQILDFEQNVDLINVVAMVPGVFEFRGTAGFAPSGNPELRLLETATGSTIVQFDTNGDGVADAEIRVAGVVGLTADDFAL
ncbi:calcium-binding protein [Antarctobacter sp.]|uniref:calcium-binding protein n=1 Tax=Antarctobacter sp. TaxID=1872577 RepID=UPI003A92A2DB